MRAYFVSTMLCLSLTAAASEIPIAGTEVPLYPDQRPSITCFPADPKIANGAAILVCPGGGYEHLAMDHEGVAVAKFFADHGISAFVLRYRIKPYRAPFALLDANAAMRLLQTHATHWNIDPARIGVVGFSAGGHVASTLGTHFDDSRLDPLVHSEPTPVRPAFMILIYPVITMTERLTHPGSRRVLLGERPTDSQVREYSNELHVTEKTPPTFILASVEDPIVPWQNSQLMVDALQQHHVPVEFIKLDHGGHGFGLGGKDPNLNTWPGKALAWLHEIKMTP